MRGWILPFAFLLGCAGSAADHERLGDTAYATGEYANALEEYRAASRGGKDARVLAKLGAVALKLGEFREAAEAYTNLAAADRTRITEAARGLELVARGADRAGSGAALEDAVEALRRLAPERVSSRYTIALLRSNRLGATEVAALGPLALAAAGDPAGVDQMLVQYGAALQGTTACSEAAAVFEAALRRSRDLAVRQRSAEGLAHCALQLGREALLVERPELAVDWFTRVLVADSGSDRARQALIGLGDARRAMGDLLGATLAWQDAIAADPHDSIAAQASSRLTQVGAPTPAADSD